MSYCRWSSDDFQCDVYVYESSGGGWITHVAGRRRVLPHAVRGAWPKITADEQSSDWATQWHARYKAVEKWLDTATEWIDLSTISPFAGESFHDESAGACADRLESLRASGLNVPQDAIDALRQEQEEGTP